MRRMTVRLIAIVLASLVSVFGQMTSATARPDSAMMSEKRHLQSRLDALSRAESPDDVGAEERAKPRLAQWFNWNNWGNWSNWNNWVNW
ncbi:hypothetical protein [Roseobacter sinensis]|nr:hypothetical protein [Roseobacter sp. WL0113]